MDQCPLLRCAAESNRCLNAGLRWIESGLSKDCYNDWIKVIEVLHQKRSNNLHGFTTSRLTLSGSKCLILRRPEMLL